MDKHITTPITEEVTKDLKSGDYVYITGKRSKEVIDAIVRNHAVYFAAVGGAGALLSKCITKSEIVCYEDLGAEAIRKIEIKDFPVIVVIDSQGDNLYETAVKEFAAI